jgi:hypothetical protein
MVGASQQPMKAVMLLKNPGGKWIFPEAGRHFRLSARWKRVAFSFSSDSL